MEQIDHKAELAKQGVVSPMEGVINSNITTTTTTTVKEESGKEKEEEKEKEKEQDVPMSDASSPGMLR